MTIKLTYDKKRHILTNKVVGHLVLQEYATAMHKIMSSNDFPPDINAIWDLTEMAFDNIDMEFQRNMIAFIKENTTKRGSAKVALVSNYDLGSPIVKLFTILSEDIHQTVKAFATIEQAQAWLLEKAVH